MSIDKNQLKRLVIEPTLRELGFYSASAVQLLLGTAAQESHMGTYIKQLRGGPALGIYQMEPNTHNDIVKNYLRYKDHLANRIMNRFDYTNFRAKRMMYDLRYATIMARLHYLRVPVALPPSTRVELLANYWKRFYNTHLGSGTEEQFIANYNHYVK